MANLLDWFKSILEAKPTECDKPEDLAGFSLSLFMVIGMFVSYLPQHFAIIKRKSSDGLSPWYQLLGALSMINILENALIFGYGLFECCSRVVCAQLISLFIVKYSDFSNCSILLFSLRESA